MEEDFTVTFHFNSMEEKQEWLGIFSDGGGENIFEEYSFSYDWWDDEDTEIDACKLRSDV